MTQADESAAQQIAALREELREHDRLYFVLGQPRISDEQYDRLMERLRALEAQHPALITPDSPTQRVGEQPLDGFEHVRHALPMLSVDNTYSAADVRDFDQRLRRAVGPRAFDYIVDPKIDGVAVSLRYEDGALVLAATRGDGEVGDDITPNVRAVHSVPLRLLGPDLPHVLEVRGEVYWPRAAFDACNAQRVTSGEEPFKNPRNATAGTLKQLDPRIVEQRGLAFQAHGLGLVQPRLTDGTQSALFERLRTWGVPTSPFLRVIGSVDALLDYIAAWDVQRRTLPYETDGLVLKVNQLALREELGATSKAPRWCIAYKYAAERAVTRLLDVEFQVGKLGTITPRARMQPVLLAGTTVQHASLHNFDQIDRLGVQINDLVEVEKAGEIIPQVIRVVAEPAEHPLPRRPIARPTQCPACRGAVVQDEGGVYLRCTNVECPAQAVERLRYFCARDQMDIEGAGEKLIEQLYDRKLVRSVADLYDLPAKRNELLSLERMGQRSVDNLLAGIEASKQRPLARLLAGLNIRHVGLSTAEDVAEHFGSMEKLLDAAGREPTAALTRFTEVDGVGDEVAHSLIAWLRTEAAQQLIARLADAGVNMTQPTREHVADSALRGKTVVVTGTLLRHSRSEVEELIKQHGGKPSGSVSKKTDYLLAGADAGSKLERAQALGVTVLSEAEFEALIARP